MAQAAADHIDREHFSVFWESLQVSSVSTFHRAKFVLCVSRWPVSAAQLAVQEVLGLAEANRGEGESEEPAEHLERLLFILHTLVSHRDGAKVTKPEAVCQVHPGKEYLLIAMSFFTSINHVCLCRQTVLQLIGSSSLSAPCSRLLLQIISSLLLGENITLPNSLIQEMVQKARSLKPKTRTR